MTKRNFPFSKFKTLSFGSVLKTALAGGLAAVCFSGIAAAGADYGRVTGTVTDPHGTPLMGVTVLVMGPAVGSSVRGFDSVALRVITDAHGKFDIEHLLPGRYAIRVTAASELPVFRSGIQVSPRQTAKQNFILTDIFAPFRLQIPEHSEVTHIGEDWKWILRTSASTRPILRYRQVSSKATRRPVEPSQRLIGLIPGSPRRAPLSSDPGMGSVLAYLRPLSDDADLLVAGSMTPEGMASSSVVTAFRRNVLTGDPQELALVVHQLNLSGGLPVSSLGTSGRANLMNGQGMVVSYAQTRRLSDSLTITSGMEIDYLNVLQGAMIARPRAKLEYRVNGSNSLTVHYGAARTGSDGALIDRVGELNAFPLITMRNHRPALEQANHGEVGWNHRINRNSSMEVAAYLDDFHDAVVRGFGRPSRWGWPTGDFLPNLNANGVNLDSGDYHSSGLRATLHQRLGDHAEADFLFASGSALAVRPAVLSGAQAHAIKEFRDILRNDRSQSLGGKFSARIPKSNTQVVTSYVWIERHRVTDVDPYGEAGLQVEPYLCLQVRQPLPSFAFLPAHVEALADFRNLLGQGYVQLAGLGEEPFILTPAYRSFRGGFSVQF